MALKILLADDSVTAQNMGKKILAAVGYDVVTVSNGVAAIKKIAEVHPDIVLLDVYMAGYTGVEVCKKMKATAEMAQMPILLTVGKMEPFCAEEAIKVKADGLITKPFDVTNLITVVEKLAGRLLPPEPAASARLSASSEPSQADRSALAARPICLRAYELYEQRGRQDGHALDDWLQAEAEVTQTKKKVVAAAPPAFSRQQGGEVCDVCGHVNREVAFACQQCDVPLPSSVMAPIVQS